MIRDYISGMQMAYFPPFKLLFLLAAFLLVVESGANLSGVNYLEQQSEQTAKKDDSIAEAHKESVKDKQRAKNFEEAGKFLDLPDKVFYVAYLTPLIPLKQLTGFKWWRTLLVVFLSYLIVLFILFCSVFIGYFVLY